MFDLGSSSQGSSAAICLTFRGYHNCRKSHRAAATTGCTKFTAFIWFRRFFQQLIFAAIFDFQNGRHHTLKYLHWVCLILVSSSAYYYFCISTTVKCSEDFDLFASLSIYRETSYTCTVHETYTPPSTNKTANTTPVALQYLDHSSIFPFFINIFL